MKLPICIGTPRFLTLAVASISLMSAADSPDPRKLGVSRGGVIPYFADGAGWATTFRLSCLEPQCAIEFAFVGSNGQLTPTPVAITVPDQSGETVVNATESV